jgi:hypothetical protein
MKYKFKQINASESVLILDEGFAHKNFRRSSLHWQSRGQSEDSTGLGLTTAYSSLPFCPDISVYKSRIRDRK